MRHGFLARLNQVPWPLSARTRRRRGGGRWYSLGRALAVPRIFADELIYAEAARGLAENGRLPVHGYGIVTPAVDAMAYLLTGNDVDAYRLIQAINVVVMVSAAFPAYLLAKRALSHRGALAVAALAVLVSVDGVRAVRDDRGRVLPRLPALRARSGPRSREALRAAATRSRARACARFCNPHAGGGACRGSRLRGRAPRTGPRQPSSDIPRLRPDLGPLCGGRRRCCRHGRRRHLAAARGLQRAAPRVVAPTWHRALARCACHVSHPRARGPRRGAAPLGAAALLNRARKRRSRRLRLPLSHPRSGCCSPWRCSR